MFVSLHSCEPLVSVDKEFGLIPAVLWGMRKGRGIPLEPVYYRGAGLCHPLRLMGSGSGHQERSPKEKVPGHKAGAQEARLLFLPLIGFLFLQLHKAWVYYY